MVSTDEDAAGLSSVLSATTGLLKRTQTPPSRFSCATVPDGPTSSMAKPASGALPPVVSAVSTTGTGMPRGATETVSWKGRQPASASTNATAHPPRSSLVIVASCRDGNSTVIPRGISTNCSPRQQFSV